MPQQKDRCLCQFATRGCCLIANSYEIIVYIFVYISSSTGCKNRIYSCGFGDRLATIAYPVFAHSIGYDPISSVLETEMLFRLHYECILSYFLIFLYPFSYSIIIIHIFFPVLTYPSFEISNLSLHILAFQIFFFFPIAFYTHFIKIVRLPIVGSARIELALLVLQTSDLPTDLRPHISCSPAW